MPYFASIIMFYHVKIACYQLDIQIKGVNETGRDEC